MASILPSGLNDTDSTLEPSWSFRVAILAPLATFHRYVTLLCGPPAVASIAPSGLNASAPPPGLKVWVRFPLSTFSRYVVPLAWDPDFRPPDAPAASILPFGLKATEDRMPATCGGP